MWVGPPHERLLRRTARRRAPDPKHPSSEPRIRGRSITRLGTFAGKWPRSEVGPTILVAFNRRVVCRQKVDHRRRCRLGALQARAVVARDRFGRACEGNEPSAPRQRVRRCRASLPDRGCRGSLQRLAQRERDRALSEGRDARGSGHRATQGGTAGRRRFPRSTDRCLLTVRGLRDEPDAGRPVPGAHRRRRIRGHPDATQREVPLGGESGHGAPLPLSDPALAG